MFLFSNRVNVVSLVREVVLALRVFRDLVDFLEHLEPTDLRSVEDPLPLNVLLKLLVKHILSHCILLKCVEFNLTETFLPLKMCYATNIYICAQI